MSVFFNPTFIFSLVLFVLNQILEKSFNIFLPYVHAYLDDCLAMPVILGITLQIYRWIHPLKNQFVFKNQHILVATGYVALVFEFVLPHFSPTYTADYWDIVCYGLGAVVFKYQLNFPKKIDFQNLS